MSLSKRVSEIIALHTQELWFVQQFSKDIDAYICELQSQVSTFDAPDQIKGELGEVLAGISEFLEKKGTEMEQSFRNHEIVTLRLELPATNDLSEECQEFLNNLVLKIFKTTYYPSFAYNMAITHVITTFEAFISDFLVAIFTQRPNTLKSQNTATFEQILSFSSIRQLVNELSITRTRNILNENIDTIAKSLNDTFSIDITKLGGFDIIREAYYRRNIIIHNKGIIDRKYHEKIPNSEVGTELSANSSYVDAVVSSLGKFIDCFDGSFSTKIRYSRDPMANCILHPEGMFSIEDIEDNSLNENKTNKGLPEKS